MATAMALTPPTSFPTIMGPIISGAKPAVKPRWSPKTKAAETANAMSVSYTHLTLPTT